MLISFFWRRAYTRFLEYGIRSDPVLVIYYTICTLPWNFLGSTLNCTHGTYSTGQKSASSKASTIQEPHTPSEETIGKKNNVLKTFPTTAANSKLLTTSFPLCYILVWWLWLLWAARNLTHISLQFKFYFTASSSCFSDFPFSFHSVLQLPLRLRHIFDKLTYRLLTKEGRSIQPWTSSFDPTKCHKQVYWDNFSTFWILLPQSGTDRYVDRQYSHYLRPHKNSKVSVFSDSTKHVLRSFGTTAKFTICHLALPVLSIAQGMMNSSISNLCVETSRLRLKLDYRSFGNVATTSDLHSSQV